MTTPDDATRFAPFAQRMEQAGMPALATETFRAHYLALVHGDTGEIPESSITPVESLPDLESLPESLAAIGRSILHKAVFVKLNGGLGTSMGLDRAKSLLPVRGAQTFLDLIARQAQDAGCPLLLMNSFSTREDTLAALAAWPELSQNGLPIDFLQHQVPKVNADSLAPAEHTDDSLTWCPPGHGDLFTALVTTGLLQQLRAAGRRYLFVSNSDNLGAVLDTRILGWVASAQIPFLMEAADRTEADRKGGHLAIQGDRFILRETAQCPKADEGYFQDHTRHRYFNTNNLWIDLDALAEQMADGQPMVLPLIRNRKTVDPRDPSSAPVYQLETAMGAAISVFPGARALRVPRSRLVPVKTTADLLRTRSDAARLEPDGRLVPNTALPVAITLDDRFTKMVPGLDAHFPKGPPSLRDCRSLTVRGDVVFGENVVCAGDVRITAPDGVQVHIPDGAHLTGDVSFDA